MSAKRSSFGMRHVTVVPTNFTPASGEDDAENEQLRSRSDDADDTDH